MMAVSPHRGVAVRVLKTEFGLAMAVQSRFGESTVVQDGSSLTAVTGWLADTGQPWSSLPGSAGRGERLAGKLARSLVAADLEGIRECAGAWTALQFDTRSGTLRVARDVSGSHSLLYRWDRDRLIIATEVAQIAAGSSQGLEPDVETIVRELVMRFEPGEVSLFKGVGAFRPGCLTTIEWGAQRSTSREFWAPPSAEKGSLAPDEAREALAAAVSACVRRSPPLGSAAITLSGGVDSGLVWVTQRALPLQGPGPVVKAPLALSLTFPGWGCDETQEIDRLIGATGGEAVCLRGDFPGVVELATVLASRLDTLPYDTAYFAVLLAQEASRRGCKILQTGHGGDHWLASPRAPATLRMLTRRAAGVPRALQRRFRALTDGASGSSGALRGRQKQTPGSLAWLAPAWREALVAKNSTGHGNVYGDDLLRNCLGYEQYGFGQRTWERLASREGLLVHHPLMDRELIEFAFRYWRSFGQAGRKDVAISVLRQVIADHRCFIEKKRYFDSLIVSRFPDLTRLFPIECSQLVRLGIADRDGLDRTRRSPDDDPEKIRWWARLCLTELWLQNWFKGVSGGRC